MNLQTKTEVLEIFFNNLKDDEQVEMLCYFLQKMTNLREKAEENVHRLEIKIDSLKDENEELKKENEELKIEIKELKTLSKEEK